MTKKRLIKTLCVTLVLVALILTMLIMLALKLGAFNLLGGFGASSEEGSGKGEYTGPVEEPFTPGGDYTGTWPSFTWSSDTTTPILQPGEALDQLIGGAIGGVAGAFSGNVPLFYVYGGQNDETLYLKLQSYGDYTGTGWDEAEEYSQLLYGVYSADYLRAFTTTFNSHDSIKISTVAKNFSYRVAPYYYRYDSSAPIVKSDVSVNGLTDDNDYIFFYSPYSGVSDIRSSEISDYEREYQAFVYDNYLALDYETALFAKKKLDQKGLYADTPRIIEKVAEYVRLSANYDLDYDRELDNESNMVIAFMDKYYAGVCSHYAAAATVLYRSLGIPARYTVGFMVDVKAGDRTTITGMDAHAWVEVYEAGQGWRYVEVTGSRNSGSWDTTEEETVWPDITEPFPSDDTTFTQPPFIEPYPPETTPDTSYDIDTAPDISTDLPYEFPYELILSPKDVEKQYDGTPLEPNAGIEGFPEELIEYGFKIEYNLFGSQTEPGLGYSEISSVSIYSPDGYDITSVFDITCLRGRIWVYRGVLVFSSEDSSATYPNYARTQQSSIRLVSAPDEFYANEYSFAYTTSSSNKVGISPARFTVHSIYNEKAQTNVVTEYKILYLYGKLTVYPAKLVIQAPSAEKVYDGTPLIAEGYGIVEGESPNKYGDHIAELIVQGSQTNPGSSENIILSIVILNAKGEDMTQNYQIEFLPGKLTVTLPDSN